MCLSPMSFLSPVGSMLFGGSKARGATAGALLGGIPGMMIGSSMSSGKKQQPQPNGG